MSYSHGAKSNDYEDNHDDMVYNELYTTKLVILMTN